MASAIVFFASIAASTASSAVRTGRGAQHEIDVRVGRNGCEAVGTDARRINPTTVGLQRLSHVIERGLGGHGDRPRRELPDLINKALRVLACRQPDDTQPIAVGGDNGQRIAPDGAGGPENGDSLHS